MSILPLPKSQGIAQGCISQLSNSVLPFPSPKMELILLRFSGTGIGGHFSPVVLHRPRLFARGLWPQGSSLAVWDRRAPVCQLHPSPSPACTAPGLAPVYAYELMDLRWGFMLLPSQKWEAHHDKNFNLLYLTFHGEPAVLSALPGWSCLPHRSGGMVPGHDPAIGTVPHQSFPVAAGRHPPHPVFPWDIVSLDSSSLSQRLPPASVAPGRA